jgi:hypothetical protein
MPTDVIGFANRLADFLLGELATALQPHWPPPQPRIDSVTLLGEDNGMLKYQLVAPEPGAPDVVSRELTITVDGVQAEVMEFAYPGDAPQFSVDDNAEVMLTLIDTDDAGNRSAPSESFTFTATDSVAPPAPGALGVTPLGEE